MHINQATDTGRTELSLLKLSPAIDRTMGIIQNMQYLLWFTGVMYYSCRIDGKMNKTDFFPTLKPMYCHHIQIYTVRSTLECALYCQDISCLGYSVTSGYGCHVCFIYDTKTQMTVAPTPSSNITSFMPILNEQEGKSAILLWMKPQYRLSTMSPAWITHCQLIPILRPNYTHLGPLLLTWFNFNPSTDE